MKVIDKVKDLRAKVYYRTSLKARQLYCWCCNNKDIVILVAPTILAFSAKLINRSFKRRDIKLEQRVKDLYVYDRSAGRYLKLRRAMKQSEQIKFDELKRAGKTTAEALMILKLL